MALEYFLKMDMETEPKQIVKFLLNQKEVELKWNENQNYLNGPGVQLDVFTPITRIHKSRVEEKYGFRELVNIGFQISKGYSQQGSKDDLELNLVRGENTIFLITTTLLKNWLGNLVLLFNNEFPILLRVNNQIKLNTQWENLDKIKAVLDEFGLVYDLESFLVKSKQSLLKVESNLATTNILSSHQFEETLPIEIETILQDGASFYLQLVKKIEISSIFEFLTQIGFIKTNDPRFLRSSHFEVVISAHNLEKIYLANKGFVETVKLFFWLQQTILSKIEDNSTKKYGEGVLQEFVRIIEALLGYYSSDVILTDRNDEILMQRFNGQLVINKKWASSKEISLVIGQMNLLYEMKDLSSARAN